MTTDLKFPVFVGGTGGGYQGKLELVRCACCSKHIFWWHKGMARTCYYCLYDEDAPPR